jgi:hypothetical protein
LIAGSDPDDEDRNCGLGFQNIRMLCWMRYRALYIGGYVKSRPSDETDLEQQRRFDL